MEIPPDLTLYHYDVVIEPNVPRAIKRKVMQGAKLQHDWVFSGQYPVFDGEKNLYCHKKLERSQACGLIVCNICTFMYNCICA